MAELIPETKSAPPESLVRLMTQLGPILSKKKPRLNAHPFTFYRMGSILYRDTNPTMRELSRALSVPLSTATRMVSLWVDNGWARRLSDPDDRRIVRVVLTDSGRRIHDIYEGATFYNTPSVTRMSGIKEGPRFRLFRIQNGTITYDNVIEYEKLRITREYNTDNTQVTIRIRNEEGFPVPLNIHVKLSPSIFPHKTDLGEIMASTASGDIWVKYSAPIGESEIQVTPTNMSKT